MGLTRIHVNRQIIQQDNKHGRYSKAIGVETRGQRKRYGYAVTIQGSARVIYRPRKPLSCGAKCWIETLSPVVVHRQSAETETP